MKNIEIGSTIPDFNLKNQDGYEIKLSSFKGKKVLISFHPLAWTKVCEIQMRSLEIKFDALRKLNIVPLGISVDSQPCKSEWAEYMDIEKTDLLADFWPHGAVAQQLGLFNEKAGVSMRANILLDEEGKVIFSKVYELSEIPNIEEIIQFVQK